MQTDGAKGLLFCGTGMGVGIVANRFSGIQAATCENVAAARAAAQLTTATCCASAARSATPDDARAICDAVWLAQEQRWRGAADATRRRTWWSTQSFSGVIAEGAFHTGRRLARSSESPVDPAPGESRRRGGANKWPAIHKVGQMAEARWRGRRGNGAVAHASPYPRPAAPPRTRTPARRPRPPPSRAAGPSGPRRAA